MIVSQSILLFYKLINPSISINDEMAMNFYHDDFFFLNTVLHFFLLLTGDFHFHFSITWTCNAMKKKNVFISLQIFSILFKMYEKWNIQISFVEHNIIIIYTVTGNDEFGMREFDPLHLDAPLHFEHTARLVGGKISVKNIMTEGLTTMKLVSLR